MRGKRKKPAKVGTTASPAVARATLALAAAYASGVVGPAARPPEPSFLTSPMPAPPPPRYTKTTLPTKLCATCGRPFAWRKKWARCWDEVKYCGEKCQRQRPKTA